MRDAQDVRQPRAFDMIRHDGQPGAGLHAIDAADAGVVGVAEVRQARGALAQRKLERGHRGQRRADAQNLQQLAGRAIGRDDAVAEAVGEQGRFRAIGGHGDVGSLAAPPAVQPADHAAIVTASRRQVACTQQAPFTKGSGCRTQFEARAIYKSVAAEFGSVSGARASCRVHAPRLTCDYAVRVWPSGLSFCTCLLRSSAEDLCQERHAMRFLVRAAAGARRCRRSLTLALTLAPISAQQAPEKVDLDAIYKIKQEGFQRSQVMEITSWLTDVYGPRLTNSPGFRKAGDWAVKEMTSWGLANVKLEPFGPFGRGWSNEKFYMMATTPGGSFPVIGISAGVDARHRTASSPGDAVVAVIETPEDIAKFKGKLKGKIVLTLAPCARCRRCGRRRRSATPTNSCDELERETDDAAAAADVPAGPAAPAGVAADGGAAARLRAHAHAVLQGRRRRSRWSSRAAATAARCSFRAAGRRLARAEGTDPALPLDHHRRRALRPHPAHAREGDAGAGSSWTSRTRSHDDTHVVQRRRRDSRGPTRRTRS